MAASRKSEADYIKFLLTIIEHVDGKPNWNEIAPVTGYKAGKFVKQALDSIKKKYGCDTTPNGKAAPMPKSNRKVKATPKKRAVEDDDEEATPSKKPKVSAKEELSNDELAGDEGDSG